MASHVERLFQEHVRPHQADNARLKNEKTKSLQLKSYESADRTRKQVRESVKYRPFEQARKLSSSVDEWLSVDSSYVLMPTCMAGRERKAPVAGPTMRPTAPNSPVDMYQVP